MRLESNLIFFCPFLPSQRSDAAAFAAAFAAILQSRLIVFMSLSLFFLLQPHDEHKLNFSQLTPSEQLLLSRQRHARTHAHPPTLSLFHPLNQSHTYPHTHTHAHTRTHTLSIFNFQTTAKTGSK